MKNNLQKGFTPIILAIFVVFVLIFTAVGFYLFQKTQKSVSPINNSAQEQKSTNSSATQSSPLMDEVNGISIDDGSVDFSQLDKDLQDL